MATVVHKPRGSTPRDLVLSVEKLARPAVDAGAPPQPADADADGTLAEGRVTLRARCGTEEHRRQAHAWILEPGGPL